MFGNLSEWVEFLQGVFWYWKTYKVVLKLSQIYGVETVMKDKLGTALHKKLEALYETYIF